MHEVESGDNVVMKPVNMNDDDDHEYDEVHYQCEGTGDKPPNPDKHFDPKGGKHTQMNQSNEVDSSANMKQGMNLSIMHVDEFDESEKPYNEIDLDVEMHDGGRRKGSDMNPSEIHDSESPDMNLGKPKRDDPRHGHGLDSKTQI